MTALTDLRVAVTEKLATDLEDLEITWYPGEYDGPARDFNVGCVFPIRAVPSRREINLRNPVFEVRVFLITIGLADPNAQVPLDPSPLEDLEERIISSLVELKVDQSIQNGYFEWEATDFNHRNQGVGLQFQAVSWSGFATSG